MDVDAPICMLRRTPACINGEKCKAQAPKAVAELGFKLRGAHFPFFFLPPSFFFFFLLLSSSSSSLMLEKDKQDIARTESLTVTSDVVVQLSVF